MSFTSIFSNADIAHHLKSYERIKDNDFSNIKKGTMIKYLTIVGDTGKYEYKMGGVLYSKAVEYIVLATKGKRWSVQLKDNVFFKKVEFDDADLVKEIDKNNRILRDLGGKSINLQHDDIDDIFNRLRKDKRLSSKSVKALKSKYNIESWLYTSLKSLMEGDLIMYIDMGLKKMSKECMIKKINRYKNGSVKNIKLYDEDGRYCWTIVPHKYHIFKNPMSGVHTYIRRENKKKKRHEQYMKRKLQRLGLAYSPDSESDTEEESDLESESEE